MTTALVVDDSQFMRTVVGNILGANGYEILTAESGADAVQAVEQYRPELVTMNADVADVADLDGIETVEAIVQHWPTRILLLADDPQEGIHERLEALSGGAIDCLSLEGGALATDLAALEQRLMEKVGSLEGADLTAITPARAGSAVEAATAGGSAVPAGAENDSPSMLQSKAEAKAAVQKTSEAKALARAAVDEVSGGAETSVGRSRLPREPGDQPQLDPDAGIDSALETEPRAVEGATVVIGASTGGPRVVEEILARLPTALEAKVLVVQHMPASFTDRLANRLDEQSDYAVREATEDDHVAPGEVLVAKGGRHLTVESASEDRIDVTLTDGPRRHGVRPSIDVTMETLAEHDSAPLVGVVLTGMGKDGAAGITELANAGATTIAQDEATSPVFGIPRRAIETGAVDHVLPDADVVAGIQKSLTGDTDG